MASFSSSTINFENGNKLFALQDVPPDADVKEIIAALELPDFSGVVTLVVAMGSMPPEIIDASRELFTKSLAPVAEKLGLLVVDGATRYGGVLAMGDARNAIGGTFPLVGVIPAGVIKVPDDLDPYHSHVILVDSNQWGGESQILPAFLNATDKRGVVIVVNCRLTSAYMEGEFPHHVRWADVIIPIGKSGGVADALLDSESDLVKSLQPNTVIRGVDLDKPEELTALLEEVFAPK
jgi:hypothetical protein